MKFGFNKARYGAFMHARYSMLRLGQCAIVRTLFAAMKHAGSRASCDAAICIKGAATNLKDLEIVSCHEVNGFLRYFESWGRAVLLSTPFPVGIVFFGGMLVFGCHQEPVKQVSTHYQPTIPPKPKPIRPKPCLGCSKCLAYVGAPASCGRFGGIGALRWVT